MLLGKRTNVLLVKDDVGKAKPTTRKIPSDQFAFGKANIFNESAAEGKSILPKIYNTIWLSLLFLQLLTSSNTVMTLKRVASNILKSTILLVLTRQFWKKELLTPL